MVARTRDKEQSGNRVLTVRKRSFGSIIRAILSISIIGALVYHIGSGEIVGRLHTVTWEALAGATLVLATSVFFVTPRWSVILSVLGLRISWRALIGSVFLGFLFNQLLPTAIGGDVLRTWRAKQLGAPWEISIYSVLLDRATGVLFSLLGAAALLPVATFHQGQAQLGWVVAAVAGLLGIGLIIMWAFSLFRHKPIPLFMGFHAALVGLHDSIWKFAKRPGAVLAIIVLAGLNQMLPVAAIFICAKAVGVSLPASDIALITFISTLAATIPISVAGWGIREGTLVYLFGLYGIRADTAFAVSILYGFALTLSSAPGAFFIWRMGSKPP
jgi:glycosyltransferase 2 family protein